ncbi:MAG: LCP family protein [Coriobacteriales bacterium]|nr:LCP family protein [Coriobacteriales bacterium]
MARNDYRSDNDRGASTPSSRRPTPRSGSSSSYSRENYGSGGRRRSQSDDDMPPASSERIQRSSRGEERALARRSDAGIERSSRVTETQPRRSYSAGRGDDRGGAKGRSGAYGRAGEYGRSRSNGRSRDAVRDDRYGRDDYGRNDYGRGGRGGRDDYGNGGKKNGKKGGKGKKIAIISLCVLLGLILAAGAGAAIYMHNISKKLHSGIDENITAALQPADTASLADDYSYDGEYEPPFYCLLLGVDKSIQRAEYSGEDLHNYRSDTIILARIDPANKQVSLLSMHRDIQINYNGRTMKLNGVYSLDGPAGMINEVSELCGGIPITHFAQIDFDCFENLVDAIGGVEVDVPYTFYDEDAGGGLEAGIQTLNGEQALVLCRARHCYDDMGDGDVYRADNQRRVIKAVAKKLLTLDKITLASTLNTIADMVVTDMSIGDIIDIATSMRGMNVNSGFYSAMAPTSGFYDSTNRVWYEKLDRDKLLEMVDRMNRGLPPDASQAEAVEAAQAAGGGTKVGNLERGNYLIRVLNGANIQGVAGKNAQLLTAYGYMTSTGDADSGDYSGNTIVYEKDADKPIAEDIAQILGGGEVIKNDGSWSYDPGDLLVIIGK